jgi:hypothetical protein
VYIDVGCWHPRWGNNTYLLHKRGWQGINIDLDLNTIEMFKNFRPNDFNKRIAVSDKNGFEELYFYHNHSPINTISKNIYEKFTSRNFKMNYYLRQNCRLCKSLNLIKVFPLIPTPLCDNYTINKNK